MDKDFRGLVPRMKNGWTKIFAYGFIVAFVGCTAFLAFNPSSNGSPLNNSLFTPSSFSATIAPYRSRFNSLISQYFPNSTSFSIEENPFDSREIGSQNDGVFQISTPTSVGSVNVIPVVSPVRKNHAEGIPSSKKDESLENNPTDGGTLSQKNGTGPLPITPEGSILKKDGILIAKNKTAIQIPGNNLTGSGLALEKTVSKTNGTDNETASKKNGVVTNIPKKSKAVPLRNGAQAKNETSTFTGAPSTNPKAPSSPAQSKNLTTSVAKVQPKNQTTAFNGNQMSSKIKEVPRSSILSASFSKSNYSSSQASNGIAKKNEDWLQSMVGCDIFHGKWVQDDSYPLYSEGSCPHIDEPFDCFLNGRPDRGYQKLRWQPDACKIPRFNALDFLQRLRGKRLVFVGDSLNRNMWESLVCGLRNSVKVKEKVLEASGRHDFRTEGSYSFLFKDYNCTVEFFRSPFLVQEWEMPDSNGKKKETLRLDIIERSSSRYKDANIIVFNTGHWWTHEKTSKGRDYYQEGNRVYSELNVVEAFHKALHTWAIWVDANVNPKKTLVFFRGYSASHFRGGQWNSGGACDKETEPIKNEKFLSPYPPKMRVLEMVINGMKTPVSYLNITRMTDFRKDAHPSIYRKQNLTDEERREPERFQDCSHWCLPGVPDSWNELLYAQILIKQKQMPNW